MMNIEEIIAKIKTCGKSILEISFDTRISDQTIRNILKTRSGRYENIKKLSEYFESEKK